MGKVAKIVSRGLKLDCIFYEKYVYLFKENVYTYKKIYVLDLKHVINSHCVAEW